MMHNSSPIRKLPHNSLGKDYVVGDLHGCFELLEQLLLEVNFDTACDRLFSVGDLIDRGCDSLRCLQLLEQPWFYAVLGNHEIMLLNFFSPYMQGKKLEDLYDNPELIFLVNGGVWVEHYYQPEQQAMTAEFNDCLQLVLDMPAIWIVGEGLSRFHVIHAELLKTNLFIGRQSVWLDRDLDNWLTAGKIAHNILERLYWGRTLMRRDTEKQQPASMQKGLSTTFCGHTYATSPRQFLSHLCLDTGAFLSLESGFIEAENYGLTLFDVEQALWFQASYARADIRTGKMMLRE